MRDAAGRSRGFAFLTFEDPAAVNAVMVREHFLDGKVVSNEVQLITNGFLASALLTCSKFDVCPTTLVH